MFTGIVTEVGTIARSEMRDDLRVVVTSHNVAGAVVGASIACSGACLTVVEKGKDWFAADVSRESLARTARGMWDAGRRLNLERALRVGDELGGHIVTGHVDGIGTVVSMVADGASHRVAIRVPPAIAPFVASKGSVTVDGVSLTVNEVNDDAEGTNFTVNIIPHSWAVTTLGELAPGREVNVEIDVLARYLKRMRDLLD